MTAYTEQLLDKLAKSEGTTLDMAKWFNFYSFDVMGDLAFGKPFDMIKDGIVHDYMAVVHTNMLAIGAFSHLIWMFPIIKAIPGLNRHNEKFQKWLYEHVRQRREVSLPSTSSLLVAYRDTMLTLQSEVLLYKMSFPGSWTSTKQSKSQPSRTSPISMGTPNSLSLLEGKYFATGDCMLTYGANLNSVIPLPQPSHVCSSSSLDALILSRSFRKKLTNITKRTKVPASQVYPSLSTSRLVSTKLSVCTQQSLLAFKE